MHGAMWSKATWEASVSSRCWEYTQYDGGWDSCEDLRNDEELAAIAGMEHALDGVPDWAERIVETSIAHVPFCAHYRFPLPFLEILDAIGSERAPDFNHGCFTVEADRKRTLSDYCLILDGWEAGASAEDTAAAVGAVTLREINWDTVCSELWGILGESTDVKRLLILRLLHYLRWTLRTTLWDDDRGNRFAQDVYLGPPADNEANRYAHPDTPAPGIDESASPRVVEMEERLAATVPDWAQFRTLLLAEWWLCAPKAFRFLEKKLWFVGKGSLPDATGFEGDRWTSAWWKAFRAADVPPFLHAEETYPDQAQAAEWWKSFKAALEAWQNGESGLGDTAKDVYQRLGTPTDVKRWLVRLYRHHTRVLQQNGEQFS